jgi:hypothetical protein
MTGSPTNPADKSRGKARPPQRKLRRADGTLDPEAKVPMSLEECFDGPFADDVADKAWRLTLKALRRRCREDQEVANHFDDSIDYHERRAHWAIPPVAWSDQIQGKAVLFWVDEDRKRKGRPNTESAVGDFIAEIKADIQPQPDRVAMANESNDGAHEFLDRRYAGPLEYHLVGADIMRLYADMLVADEAERGDLCRDLRAQVCTWCGDGDGRLRRAAVLWPQVCAVFHVEDPSYRAQSFMDQPLRRFAAASQLVTDGQDSRLLPAFWLMEWGWGRAEALQIAGLANTPRWMKAINRFKEYVDRDAPAITLKKDDDDPAPDPLLAHIPPLRTVDAS